MIYKYVVFDIHIHGELFHNVIKQSLTATGISLETINASINIDFQIYNTQLNLLKHKPIQLSSLAL